MKILITGCAGFIGFHLSKNLLNSKKNFHIYGIDNINNYYSVKLKNDRLKILNNYKNFTFKKMNLSNKSKLTKVFDKNAFDIVIHLAAQAGVRYSFTHPEKYLESNIISFNNILELSRINSIKNIFFASSSSVYGNQKKFPINETENLSPISIYGETKVVNEILAKSYAENFNIKITGLRFFTAYGPYGRPDMALFKFVDKIKKGKKIPLFNYGKHERDFTYIDDVINSVVKLMKIRLNKKKLKNYLIFNIASGKPRKLNDFINIIENNLKIKAKFNNLSLQKGDVIKTHGDIKNLVKYTNFEPKFNIELGIKKFVHWYLEYTKHDSKI